MKDRAAAAEFVTERVAGHADEWDRQGELPREVVRDLAARGILCAQAPSRHGGLELSSRDNGELTAHAGILCGSVRSLMTSQGMAAWTVQRLGTRDQQAEHLARLTSGEIAGVALSEAGAGSDLSAIRTEIRRDGERIVVDGAKVWVTGAHYADWILVFGRYGDGAGLVMVPARAPGVRIDRIADPFGCRAAGHADVRIDDVHLSSDHLLAGAGLPISVLATVALTYGRVSVAWGCVGMLRACLSESARHARARNAFGAPLAEHQLIRRHLAVLFAAERASTSVCEEASRLWDDRSPDHVAAAVVAKYVAAGHAAQAARSAMQVLASAAARDGHVVARAYRDAKLMEIIEGSTEVSELMLAETALAVWT